MKSVLRKTFSFAPGFGNPDISVLVSEWTSFEEESREKQSKKKNSFKRKSKNKEITKEVPVWTVDDVCHWVSKLNFSTSVVEAFRSAQVDGDLLLQIDEQNLKDDLEVNNGIHRKRFMRELNKLKSDADYSSKTGGEEIAKFLEEKVGAEYKAYAYNLIKNDLKSLDLMRRLGEQDLVDMLKEAGVSNSVHRHRIVEAVYDIDDQVDKTCEEVYICYDSARSADLASTIRIKLEFRDIIAVSGNDFQGSHDEVAVAKVEASKNFVLIMTEHFMQDLETNARLRREVVAALTSGCNVIPVVEDGFKFPAPEEMPDDIRHLCYFNGVRWVHDYQDACVEKLERFIRGEALRPADSLSRLRSDSGRSTPTRFGIGLSPISVRKIRPRTISVSSYSSSVSG